MAITAKPLKWEEEKSSIEHSWSDESLGFYITEDLTEPPEIRFMAYWGESDAEHFATLEAAKAWCQEEINSFIRHYAIEI